jgi:inositol-phosphate transport system ATP-binding protein
MADRIICMRAGLIEQIGTPDDLYRRPESLFVAGFIGSPPINLVEGQAVNGTIRAGVVSFAATGGAAGAVTIGLRPEHLHVADAGLPGTVAQLEPMGREILYVIETGVGYVRLLEQGSSARHAIGAAVRVGFDPSNSLVFNSDTGKLVAGARVQPAV